MGLFAKPEPEVEALDEVTRRWLVERVDIKGEFGFSLGERQARYETMRCQYCQGVHFRACPRVRSLRYHENGQLARVDFWRQGEFDEAGTIWPEMVFTEDTGPTE